MCLICSQYIPEEYDVSYPNFGVNMNINVNGNYNVY